VESEWSFVRIEKTEEQGICCYEKWFETATFESLPGRDKIATFGSPRLAEASALHVEEVLHRFCRHFAFDSAIQRFFFSFDSRYLLSGFFSFQTLPLAYEGKAPVSISIDASILREREAPAL